MQRRQLLVTTTGEPYRLTYSIPGRAYVAQRLRRLRCIDDDRSDRTMRIWLEGETRALELETPAKHVEALGQRVLLGNLRFPSRRSMALQVRSHQRAIQLARLLRSVLGPEAQLVRGRVVNRWFGADELTGELDDLDRCLDRNVTVIRWEDHERELDEALAGASTQEEKQRAHADFHAARRDRDVPLVEDFPLHPEDENENMTDLANVLRFRFVRASRHWNGEKVTLRQIIEELVAQRPTFHAQ